MLRSFDGDSFVPPLAFHGAPVPVPDPDDDPANEICVELSVSTLGSVWTLAAEYYYYWSHGTKNCVLISAFQTPDVTRNDAVAVVAVVVAAAAEVVVAADEYHPDLNCSMYSHYTKNVGYDYCSSLLNEWNFSDYNFGADLAAAAVGFGFDIAILE